MDQSAYQHSVFLRMCGDKQGAFVHSRRLTKKYPVHPLSWIEFSASCALKYDLEKAQLAMTKALKHARGDVGYYLIAAEALIGVACDKQAIVILRDALKLEPQNQLATIKLARQLERNNQVEESLALIEDLISNQCGKLCNPEALFVYATLLKRQNKPERALGILEELISKTIYSAETKDTLWHAYNLRIQCFDSLKSYAEATEAFHSASQFTQKHFSKSIVTCQNSWRSTEQAMLFMANSVNKKQLEEWQSAPPVSDQSICFLSGHPRSGTTLAGTILSSHEETVLLDERDIYFSDAFMPLLQEFPKGTPDVERLQRATKKSRNLHVGNYLNLVEQATGRQLTEKTLIDKHPLHIHNLPGAIRLFPQAQHLIMLRDPRAVVLSCLLTTTNLTLFSVNWLDPAKTAQCYASVMRLWEVMQDWDLPNIHTLRYESLIADQEKETRNIAGKLGFSWSEQFLNYQQNAKTQRANSPTYEQVTRPIYSSSVEKWKHYENLLEPAMPILEQMISNFKY